MITGRKGRIRRLAPFVPAGMFLSACGLSFLLISSCRSPRDEGIAPGSGDVLQGVPAIRVRLTAAPVQAAVISSTGPCSVRAGGAAIFDAPAPLARTVFRRNGTWLAGDRTAPGTVLEITAADTAGRILFDGGEYRGALRLVAAPGKTHFFVDNTVDLESYVASVAACELLSNFQPATFRAQAVAARTYALYEMATRRAKQGFDVWASVRSQVYRGAGAETPVSRGAAAETRGWVLAYGPPGGEHIFLTQYSACNGGYVNPARILRDIANPIPPLEGGQRDEDGRICPRWTWDPVVISKKDLFRALAAKYRAVRRLGGLRTIAVREQTDYGRPVWLSVVGPGGDRVPLRAEKLRLALLGSRLPAARALYSMNCTIRDAGDHIEFRNGKGFGHGVGLSQWSAEGKARRGLSAEQILLFYYRGARIFRAY